MNAHKPVRLPARLETLRRRFQRWRETHKPPSRIPDALWARAARMAGLYGLHHTARTLRLEYYALKRRVGQSSTALPQKRGVQAAAAFVEWPAAVPVTPCECVLELEDGRGAKMHVSVKTATTPDLTALSRSFWDPAR
jgi:hypothetical protein